MSPAPQHRAPSPTRAPGGSGGRRAEATAGRGHLCVVLHDVSPARWAGCVRVLARLRSLAAEAGTELPLTLLVVPCLQGVSSTPRHYLRWLQRQAALGHELMLHGLTHHDDGPAPRCWREHLLRRVYGAGEGEFSALGHAQAAQRIARARQWVRDQGLSMPGFVAPVWLTSEGARVAVREAGFTHTCTLNQVIALPGGEALRARSLVFSTRSAWRRGASVLWNSALAWQQQHTEVPLMRLELHPGDCDHPAVQRCWSALLLRALRDRTPLRMAEAAALARHPGTRPALPRS